MKHQKPAYRKFRHAGAKSKLMLFLVFILILILIVIRALEFFCGKVDICFIVLCLLSQFQVTLVRLQFIFVLVSCQSNPSSFVLVLLFPIGGD